MYIYIYIYPHHAAAAAEFCLTMTEALDPEMRVWPAVLVAMSIIL